LTRIYLSFIENPRSNWVVIIGLELLSLACPGPKLGSEYVLHFIAVSPCHGYGYLDPTSVENRIWVIGLELASVIPTVQGYCPVRCWKPVASYHTQI
jgi:hypothetical protein